MVSDDGSRIQEVPKGYVQDNSAQGNTGGCSKCGKKNQKQNTPNYTEEEQSMYAKHNETVDFALYNAEMIRIRDYFANKIIPEALRAQEFNDTMWKLYNDGNLPATIRPGGPENYNFAEDPQGFIKGNA